jgi:hypothetical protein
VPSAISSLTTISQEQHYLYNTTPVTKFSNVSGVPHNTIHANNFHFYEEVNEIVQEEPAEALDPETLGLLATIGIEKGKPVAPDARQKKILEQAVTVGEAMAKTMNFRSRLPGIRYRPDATWEYVIPPWYDVQQDVGNSTQLDERIALYYSLWGMSYGSVTKIRGVGQVYLSSFVDNEGQPFDGPKSYRLRVQIQFLFPK